MTLFEVIFLGLLVAGWLVVGVVPWMAVSVATRGEAGLANLPLCLVAAVAGGLLVPLVGLTDGTGLWLSFLAALLLPSGLMLARRLSLGAIPERSGAAAGDRAE
jgi:hypothetical protein